MKYGRTDSAHADFRDYFRAHGCEWEDTSSVGKGFPDAIVCKSGLGMPWPHATKLALVEIKSGTKARTKLATAKKQQFFASRFPVFRIATLAEADELIQWLRS